MDTNPTPQRLLRQSLILYLALLAGLWLIGMAGVYARARMLHLSDVTTPFWFNDGKDSHSDLTTFDPTIERFRFLGKPIVVYPPPMMSVYMPLYKLTKNPLPLFTAGVFCVYLAAVVWFGSYLSRRSPANKILLWTTVIASAVLYYPFWFEVERSNMEIVVWVAVTLAAIFLLARWYKLAALFIGLSASMKIYPGILLLILLEKKRYRELALSLCSIVVFWAVGLWSLNHNLTAAFQEFRDGLAILNHDFISGFVAANIGFDHSLFSPAKQVLRILNPDLAKNNIPLLNTRIALLSPIYTVAVPVCFAAAYLVWIRRLPFMNQLVILLVLSVTLPPMSFEYTLLQVLPAFGTFLVCVVDATGQGLRLPRTRMWGLLGAFALIAAPLSYVAGRYAGLGGQLKLAALVTIVILMIRFPCPTSAAQPETR